MAWCSVKAQGQLHLYLLLTSHYYGFFYVAFLDTGCIVYRRRNLRSRSSNTFLCHYKPWDGISVTCQNLVVLSPYLALKRIELPWTLMRWRCCLFQTWCKTQSVSPTREYPHFHNFSSMYPEIKSSLELGELRNMNYKEHYVDWLLLTVTKETITEARGLKPALWLFSCKGEVY
jgi:hypothetical protein